MLKEKEETDWVINCRRQAMHGCLQQLKYFIVKETCLENQGYVLINKGVIYCKNKGCSEV